MRNSYDSCLLWGILLLEEAWLHGSAGLGQWIQAYIRNNIENYISFIFRSNFPLKLVIPKQENLMIYSLSLSYSYRDTPSKYVAVSPYSDVVGMLYRSSGKVGN